LPQAITPHELDRLLAGCDRLSPSGRRDYAILILLSRLGLRAGEVAAMELGDIDWRAGEVIIRGKGGRKDRLPLPVDVGEAIADWLRLGRPAGLRSSALFTRHRAPLGPMLGTGVSAVVRRAGRRAGLAPFGAHRLRHTTAVEPVKSFV
jgi:integrase